MVDALHAVVALLHHAALAHRHVGVAHQLEHRRGRVLVLQEIKPPHLIGTVVRAIPRPYAAVVNHVIQAFGAVRGRAHRTNQFAGRVLALHARDRLEVRLGIIAIALIIGIHAQPVHVAAFVDLVLADDRNVVFRLAGNDAIVAADARVQINRHAPGIRLL